MTVGLPGTGIGGVFYLLSALCLPVAVLFRRTRRAHPWREMAAQWFMAVGVLAGLWVTGWLLALTLTQTPLAGLAARATGEAGRLPNVLRTGSVAVALGMLASVIISVWVAAFLFHGPAAFRRAKLPSPESINTPPPLQARAASSR